MTNRERAWRLERALRLEAECATLRAENARLRRTRLRITPADVAQWRDMRASGVRVREIAAQVSVPASTISRHTKGPRC